MYSRYENIYRRQNRLFLYNYFMKKNIPFEYPVNPYDPFYDAYFSPLIKDTPANRWAIYCALRNSNPKLEEEKTIYRK